MRALPALLTLLAALALAPRAAHAESWDPGEVAAAERLRAEEAARAAAYRERVARGDVRAAAAPQARSAPQTPARGDEPASEALREAADIVELIEGWFGGGAEDVRAEPRREERRRERERSRGDGDDWWAEEERRLREGQ
jgi:hypothetical protein